MLSLLARLSPSAKATVRGGEQWPDIYGEVKFYQLRDGVAVISEIYNLPQTETNIFAMHIHEEGDCGDNFARTGAHYNPQDECHPLHAGDLPSLFSNNGYAFSGVFTNRFNVSEVLGRSVIIHDKPDDFRTQPSGDSGEKIACGIIE